MRAQEVMRQIAEEAAGSWPTVAAFERLRALVEQGLEVARIEEPLVWAQSHLRAHGLEGSK